MQDLLFITWDVDPEMFTIPGINWPVRWYGLLFACAFLASQYVMGRVFKAEQRPAKYLDILTIYIVVGTILGARLGHCLFYGPWFDVFDKNGLLVEEGFISHPLNILKIWEGGLASHGAAIGIIISMWLYCRRAGENLMWLFDRITIVVPLSGMLIRIGNLMNSEIVGRETDVAWGFKFVRLHEDIVRHPSQLYEAVFCLFLTILMFCLWKYKRGVLPPGFMFGLFCVLLFTQRFVGEFYKEVQVDWENKVDLKQGQSLSIPLIIYGAFLMFYSYYKQRQLHKKTE